MELVPTGNSTRTRTRTMIHHDDDDDVVVVGDTFMGGGKLTETKMKELSATKEFTHVSSFFQRNPSDICQPEERQTCTVDLVLHI